MEMVTLYTEDDADAGLRPANNWENGFSADQPYKLAHFRLAGTAIIHKFLVSFNGAS